MDRDETINQIYKHIQIEYRREYGIELSLDKIHEIVDSQFTQIPNSIENSVEVKLDYFGKFTIKPGRIDAINNSKKLKEAGITGEKRIEAIKVNARNKEVPTFKISSIIKKPTDIDQDEVFED